MVIAVDIRFSEEYQHFIFEVLKKITEEHPSHSFIFIFDKPFDPSFIFPQNVTAVISKAQKISLLTDLTISSLLKKYQADVMVTAKYLSQAKVPQCLICFDKLTTRAMQKAAEIITCSEYSKKEIIEKHNIEKNKIDVVYPGVDEIFLPITFQEKERMKEQYSAGNEFFLFSAKTASHNNLLNLLKAFSAFKKRQKSNMQLLIAIKNDLPKPFLEALRLFKYKNEVQILAVGKNELAKITGAAYAFLYPLSQRYLYALQAMRTGVPVITSTVGYMPEICGDAALYFDEDDHEAIADKMMRIYKDEKLRQQLIENGRRQIKKYSWDNIAAMFWTVILKTNV